MFFLHSSERHSNSFYCLVNTLQSKLIFMKTSTLTLSIGCHQQNVLATDCQCKLHSICSYVKHAGYTNKSSFRSRKWTLMQWVNHTLMIYSTNHSAFTRFDSNFASFNVALTILTDAALSPPPSLISYFFCVWRLCHHSSLFSI